MSHIDVVVKECSWPESSDMQRIWSRTASTYSLKLRHIAFHFGQVITTCQRWPAGWLPASWSCWIDLLSPNSSGFRCSESPATLQRAAFLATFVMQVAGITEWYLGMFLFKWMVLVACAYLLCQKCSFTRSLPRKRMPGSETILAFGGAWLKFRGRPWSSPY